MLQLIQQRTTKALMLICTSALVSMNFGTAASAADTPHAAPQRKVNPAPSADLHYAINAQQSGITLNGEGLLTWRSSGTTYSIDTETRSAMLGKIIESKSAGAIDTFGLAPATFTEKRWRKQPTTTTFNRTDKAIHFSTGAETYPLLGGEQDRNSAVWQLIAVARANAAAFKPNSTWDFFVAGPRDAEPWSFKVIKEEQLATAVGEQRTVHIKRAPPPDSKGQHLDIWLAPAREWYPVKIRFSDGDGDFIEQTLEKIGKPAG
jgi:hypothetical protein